MAVRLQLLRPFARRPAADAAPAASTAPSQAPAASQGAGAAGAAGAPDRTAARAALLGKVDLFSGLDRVALARLAANLDPVEFAPEAPACTQGEPGDSLYIISQGAMGVYISTAGGTHEIRVATLGPGACFGEMALLTGEPRSATVRAVESAEALRLERTRFIELLRREPTIGLAISATLSRRLGSANQSIVRGEKLIVESVAQRLDHLPADQRMRVLQASVLERPDGASLEALFGDDSTACATVLTEIGVPLDNTPPPPAVLRALRQRFE